MKFNTGSHGVQSKAILDCDVTTVKFVLPHSKDMATCSYSEFVGGCCGPSSGNPANIQCVALGKCTKDVRGHLKSFKVRDSCVNTEASLLLARAGNFLLLVNICNKGVIHSSLNLFCCLIHIELNLYPGSHILKGIRKILKTCHAIC